jgi:4-hydroxybutyrate CoA-transferase
MTRSSSWRAAYNARLTSAAAAVRRLDEGMHLIFPTMAGEPPAVIGAMSAAAQAGEMAHIMLSNILPGRHTALELHTPEVREWVHWNSFFCGGSDRQSVFEGACDMTPMHFSQVPMVMERYMPCQAIGTLVSPPDEEGFMTPSLAVDYTKHMLDTAQLKIVEVNPNVPRVYGNCRVHVEDVDVIVESDDPIQELPSPKLAPEDDAIGQLIAERIPDGATLQIGFGAVPGAVALSLKNHKHLGIHSEMFVDNMRVLMESGVIDNSRKTLHPGKSLYTFCAGQRETYAFLHENEAIEAHPVDYTNDPFIIAKHDHMISINSMLAIDLTGQACAESIGPMQYSGPGGQLDFVRGAVCAREGHSFLATYSTAKGGTISRIVDTLPEGSVVTTPRTDIDKVVTEFGVAELRGKSLRARAQALIAIAHPDFRDDLQNSAAARGLGVRKGPG